MSTQDDLKKENRLLRRQLVELAKCMRDVQDLCVQEDVPIELKALLWSVPADLLYPSLY
jgi:hypothetical protein